MMTAIEWYERLGTGRPVVVIAARSRGSREGLISLLREQKVGVTVTPGGGAAGRSNRIAPARQSC